MPSLDFNPRTLATLKDPKKGQDGSVKWLELFDRSEGGLYLRCSSTGARTWMLAGHRVLRGGEWKRARFKLGDAWTKDHPDRMGLAEARTAADALKKDLKAGIDPQQRQQDQDQQRLEANRTTFEWVADRFLEHCRNEPRGPRKRLLRPATVVQYVSFLKGDDFAAWRHRPLSAITRRDVLAAVRAIKQRTPQGVAANRGLASLRALMNWAVKEGYIDAAPTDHVDAPTPETPRDRHLFGDPDRQRPSELALAWRAFERCGTYAPFLKLLMLTGQRRDEVAGTCWDELVDLDGANPRWVLSADRTKNRRDHTLPLGPMAVEVIQSVARRDNVPFLFSTTETTPISGFSKMKTMVDKAIVMVQAVDPVTYQKQFREPWTFHDLRRTISTGLLELGVREAVVDLLLNHVSGESRRGVRKHYDHARHDAAKREAVLTWERHIQRTLDPKQAKVVSLVTAAR